THGHRDPAGRKKCGDISLNVALDAIVRQLCQRKEGQTEDAEEDPTCGADALSESAGWCDFDRGCRLFADRRMSDLSRVRGRLTRVPGHGRRGIGHLLL